MKLKMILSVLLIVGALDFSEAKKFHHHKKYKKAHKKVVKSHHTSHHRLINPSLPTAGVAGPINQLELQNPPNLVPKTPLPVLPAVLPLENGLNNGRHSQKQFL